MKAAIRISVLTTVLFAGLTAAALGQELPMKQQQCFSDKANRLGMNPQFAYQHRINVAAYNKLKKQGVDLQQMARRWGGGFTPLEQVLLVPVVAKVKVIGLEEAPRDNPQFRVVYSLQVQQTLAGNKLPSLIELYSRSSGGGSFQFHFNADPVLQVGEEAVVYLSQQQVEGQQQKPRRHNQPRYEEISIRPQLTDDQKQNAKTIYTAIAKYTVKNGQLLDAWGRPIGTEHELKKLASRIQKTNKRSKFFSRNYCG